MNALCTCNWLKQLHKWVSEVKSKAKGVATLQYYICRNLLFSGDPGIDCFPGLRRR